MKLKLLFLLLLASFSSYAQYTLIPDTKFENALITQGIDKDGLNGKVLTSSINTITVLDVSFLDIADLTGIQGFTSLTSLSCYLNLLTSLDVSKNTKLSTIDCRGNKLTSLDLSNLSLLTGVFCSENFLTSLDVSKNPLLMGVFCSKNNLISLNVKNGNNTNFQDLFCDFRYNPLLSCIQVDDVAYSNANWVDFKDTSTIYSNSCGPSYTTIPDSNFENKLISLSIDTDGKNGKILTSSIISLTTLDVSNSLITDLTGIENFLNLTTLNVSGNQLSLLNIASLKKIKTLDCSNNLLNLLDLTENTSLVTLNFATNQVSALELGNQTSIVTLKASANKLTTIDVNALDLLKTLEVDGNQLTNLNLYNNNSLSLLKCNNNLLTTLDVSQNTALNSLYCGNNQLAKLDITTNLLLREITCENNLLTQLNLKNGKNSLFTVYDFRNNPNLQCIEVDNESYSNLNWSTKKDVTTNYNLYCGPFTLIPDPKFEDKLIALGIDIDGKNGKIVTNRIVNLSTLDVSSSTISDLTGIQDFTNLKTLNVVGNQLTTLDISKNILLENLNCSNNQIASLDFTKHFKLIDLYCNNNNLNVLNLKNGKNNLLINFDFRNNPSLSCILVDNEAYSNLYWSSKKDATSNFALLCGAFTIIPDSAFEFLLIVNGIDKDGQNGKVLTSSIEELTTLDLIDNGYFKTIKNLTGIQDFKKLIHLKCADNAITTLDLSQNLALETLDCSYNSLTSLDLSQNIRLKSLICSRNSLVTLNISKNTSLTTLDCDNNLLTTLDIVNNLSLNDLDCSFNQFANLDVSKNSLLTKFHCQYNKLLNLNILNNSFLTIVDCTNNKLDFIDLSNNSNLITFKCSTNFMTGLNVSNLALLTSLDCSYNKITALDLLKNANLISIDCSVNKLADLDISKCTTLINFNAYDNPLSSLNFKNGNNINMPKLGFYNLYYLTCIQVDNKEYADKNWIISPYMAAHFSEDCNQFTLIPDGNFEDKLINLGIDIDGKNGKIKTSQIADIKYLDVSKSNISDLTGIQDFKSLTELSCYSNNISSLDVSQNSYLATLNCYSNKLTVLDVSQNRVLSDLFCNNNLLATLDVSKNTLLTSLKCNDNKLINLNLKNGNNANFISVNTSFLKNPTLSCILVDNKTYSNTKWTALKDPTASYSDVSCTQYTFIPDVNFENKLIALGIDSGVTDGKVLTSNVSTVTSLDVKSSSITNLNGIQDFIALKTLNCDNNQLTNLDVSKNKDLTLLSCYNNLLSIIDVSQNFVLKDLFCNNNSLTSLDVSENMLLTSLKCNDNKLINLNLKNGNNTNFVIINTSFLNNPTLSCILVDNKTFSNANWTALKDATATYGNTSCLQYTIIPDVNFENKLIALGIDTDGVKGEVLTSNINTLTSLDVSGSTISNLTGIQDFVALKNLNCSFNLVTNLDISKNVALTNLDCNYNLLTKLDVSKNINLTSLHCDANQLTNLDASNNIVLTDLECNENQLTNIDVSQNTVLMSLYCEANQLINLDVSKNTILNSLNCNLNQITSLDVSNNTVLTYLSCIDNKLVVFDISKNLALTWLNCSYNQLTNLDVSKNSSLTFLGCIDNRLTTVDVSKNLALSDLECGGYTLTNIDVSKNLALRSLNCENSEQLTYLDVSKNVALTTLFCDYTSLSILDLSKNVALINLLCYDTKLTSLNLKNGNNKNLKVGSLYSYTDFRNNPNLTCIQVDDASYSNANWATSKDATASYSDNCPPPSILVSTEFEDKLMALGIDIDGINGSVLLSDITNVKSIDVSNSGITNLSGIEYFTALETLICKGNSLTTINVSHNLALKYLDCSNNPLTTLDVSKNILLVELYCDGIVIIGNKISNTKTYVGTQLTVLDLSNNVFLTKLSCSNNQLVSLDVSKNTLLTDLNCSNNSLQNLNVNNTNNTNMVNINFKNNASLSCIKVDNDVYSNANWAAAKDPLAIYSKTACTLGVNDLVFDKIVLYPNPVKGQLHINNIVLEKTTIYDSLGKLIQTTMFTKGSNSNDLDVSNLTRGVYFIYLQSEESGVVKKIIVE